MFQEVVKGSISKQSKKKHGSILESYFKQLSSYFGEPILDVIGT